MAAKKRENAFDLPKLDEYFTTQEQRDDAKLKKIHEIPLSRRRSKDDLCPFEQNQCDERTESSAGTVYWRGRKY